MTTQQHDQTEKKKEEKVPKELKKWVKREIYKYCRQVKIPRKEFPTSIIYSVREMNKLSGCKPTDKTTSCNRRLGTCDFYLSEIYINVPKHKGNTNDLLNTIVHEVLHYKFLGLDHNTPSTRAMFNKIVDLVLKEGKTATDLLRGKDKVIIQRKNKPPMHRRDGTLMYWYTYARTLNSKSKLKTKAYYKVNMYKGLRQHKTRSHDIIECPEIQGYIENHPDIKARRYSFYPLTRPIPIRVMINSLLRSLRYKIRSTLYNNDESIDIILDYDKNAIDNMYRDMEEERTQILLPKWEKEREEKNEELLYQLDLEAQALQQAKYQ